MLSPRKGEKKGGEVKNPEIGSDEANWPSRIIFPDLYLSKQHIAHCQSLKQDVDGGLRNLKSQTSF